jgi:hypothetical protein
VDDGGRVCRLQIASGRRHHHPRPLEFHPGLRELPLQVGHGRRRRLSPSPLGISHTNGLGDPVQLI